MDGFHLDDNCTVSIHFCVTGAATLNNLVFSTWSLFGQYLQVSYHREDDRQMFAASAVMRMLHQSAVVKRVWLSVKVKLWIYWHPQLRPRDCRHKQQKQASSDGCMESHSEIG